MESQEVLVLRDSACAPNVKKKYYIKQGYPAEKKSAPSVELGW
jgi:hypothetical protein